MDNGLYFIRVEPAGGGKAENGGILVLRNGRILGATILGAAAGDLILPWALAISQKLKLGALANLIVPYPTRGEAGTRAAGAYYTPTLFAPRTRRLVRLLARFG